MDNGNDRRTFMKMVLGASLASALKGSTPGVAQPATRDGPPGGNTLLEPFDYSGVRLLDGPLKKQYQAARDYYYQVPNDDILNGFRQRVGLSAPGRGLGGWCQRDAGEVLGQWLSGMSRMYKATGDTAILEKATYLMHEWAKAAAKDGEYFSSRRNLGLEHSHYIFDKTVCGLVDMCLYGGQKDALPILETMVDRAAAIFDRTRTPRALTVLTRCRAATSGIRSRRTSTGLISSQETPSIGPLETSGGTQLTGTSSTRVPIRISMVSTPTVTSTH